MHLLKALKNETGARVLQTTTHEEPPGPLVLIPRV